ncbi:MAG: DegT/DnrJ/EryC1/StrS family aminotransferase [Deltaproteobacteria bacterium]|nr:DegT/DnrJ/EryC1/StrS family aminotransferase [Deltaproteobacteria bacterium]
MRESDEKVLCSIKNLAIFGAPPFFKDKLHVGQPNIGDRARLIERLNDILDRRWLTNSGHYEGEFEQRIRDYLEVKHCIATCNGTLALQLAERALNLSGEVLVPSFTFIATAHSLSFQEIKPVFCDVLPGTFLIDPEDVRRKITPRTTAIMGVHVFGRPCAVEELQEIANQQGLKLLYDAAHALGCTHKGKKIGSFGNAEVFSFHATKFINSFEGGAVTTNDDELANRLRLLRNFGFAGMDHVIGVGTNAKMSEICAAMGITNLEAMNTIMAHNYANYQRYKFQLQNIPGLELVTYEEEEKRNYQYIVVRVDPDRFGLTRDELFQLLQAENALARRYFYPGCHRMAPYGAIGGENDGRLPHTEKISSEILALPTGSGVSLDKIDLLCCLMKFIHAQAEKIRRLLEVN